MDPISRAPMGEGLGFWVIRHRFDCVMSTLMISALFWVEMSRIIPGISTIMLGWLKDFTKRQ